MVNVTLRATSIPDLDAWAEAVADGCADATPAIAEVLREDADRCFEESRDPWGVAWEALKPATIAERERIGKTGKILIRDGVLRGAIFGLPVSRSPGQYDAEIAVGGPAAAYAAWHQFGPWSRAYFPIRPDGTVDLPAAVDAEVTATIRDAVNARMEVAMRIDLAAEE